MNLKKWRTTQGYSLREVAALLGKNSPSTIFYWEVRGVKRAKFKDELRRISLGKITNFGACK